MLLAICRQLKYVFFLFLIRCLPIFLHISFILCCVDLFSFALFIVKTRQPRSAVDFCLQQEIDNNVTVNAMIL